MHKYNVVGEPSNHDGKAVGILARVGAVLTDKCVNTVFASSATFENISGRFIPRRLKNALLFTTARSQDVNGGRRDLGVIICSNTCVMSTKRIFPSGRGVRPLLLL